MAPVAGDGSNYRGDDAFAADDPVDLGPLERARAAAVEGGRVGQRPPEVAAGGVPAHLADRCLGRAPGYSDELLLPVSQDTPPCWTFLVPL